MILERTLAYEVSYCYKAVACPKRHSNSKSQSITLYARVRASMYRAFIIHDRYKRIVGLRLPLSSSRPSKLPVQNCWNRPVWIERFGRFKKMGTEVGLPASPRRRLLHALEARVCWATPSGDLGLPELPKADLRSTLPEEG